MHAHIATLLLSAAVHYISESRVYTEAKVVALEAVALQQTSEREISKREHAAMLQLEAEQERVRERERSLQGENASTVYPGTRICSTIHE